jgi:Ni,Fe-hydrogenase III large subunit/Ni,Fe-hydrogenase III component G
MNRTELIKQIQQRWPDAIKADNFRTDGSVCEISCAHGFVPQLCGWLFLEWKFSFAGLVVEQGGQEWQLRHCFYGEADAGWIHVVMRAPLRQTTFPSIVRFVHAADWHEREAEDLFGLHFEGHPRLGDFILHDDAWQENVVPMRREFDPAAALYQRKPDANWRPGRIVHEPGAFVMPIGPKYSGVTEPVHFLLETVGEDVIRSVPRLFYKWRAIEKVAEGKAAEDVLLLAERFAANTAFAHGLAYCLAVEAVTETVIPERARVLRVFLAELERLRQHAGAIQEICESTALVVANSQAGILEEDLLRICGELTGHRYLFGMLRPGGLLSDLPDESCRKAMERSKRALQGLQELRRALRVSSSFLDRLEEVGTVSQRDAVIFGLLGPVARASGLVRDLRRAQPYLGYENFQFDVPSEQEGDGYARLRVLFNEATQSVRIMEQALGALQSGNIYEPLRPLAGAALGWAEAPRGGTFHWVRLTGDGRVSRYRIVPPSLANWHGFHLAVEKFAFQDFPIMLSTFDLSVAENDR